MYRYGDGLNTSLYVMVAALNSACGCKGGGADGGCCMLRKHISCTDASRNNHIRKLERHPRTAICHYKGLTIHALRNTHEHGKYLRRGVLLQSAEA
jgi:hypothetical protein